MLKPFLGVLPELMLNILLPKSQFRFGLGIGRLQDTEQVLLWRFLVETKEIMLLLYFKGQSGMQEIKIF
jgi:hypothetical protein